MPSSSATASSAGESSGTAMPSGSNQFTGAGKTIQIAR